MTDPVEKLFLTHPSEILEATGAGARKRAGSPLSRKPAVERASLPARLGRRRRAIPRNFAFRLHFRRGQFFEFFNTIGRGCNVGGPADTIEQGPRGAG